MAANWFDLDDEAPAAEIVPREPDILDEQPNRNWLLSRQKKIFTEATRMLETALMAQEIDPGQEKAPDEWIAKLGEKEANRRYRIARAAWLNAKESPVMFKIAKELVVGISKAIAQDPGGPRILNLQIVNMPATQPAPQFPIMELEEEPSKR